MHLFLSWKVCCGFSGAAPGPAADLGTAAAARAAHPARGRAAAQHVARAQEAARAAEAGVVGAVTQGRDHRAVALHLPRRMVPTAPKTRRGHPYFIF